MDRSKRSEKEDFWRMIIADQQASGLSARAFCKRDGISESMFYNWRSKLAARDSSPPADTTPQLIPVAVSSKTRSPILANGNEPENTSQQIEIQTPGGFMLRVSDAIGSSSLGRLLSVVAHVDRDQQFESGAIRC
jgi:transposase-like protein